MPLRLPCPNCGSKLTLDEPFPMPGSMRKCVGCGSGLAISYPAGVFDRLRSMRKRFEGDPVPDPGAPPEVYVPRAPPPPPPSSPGRTAVTSTPATEVPATQVVATEVDLDDLDGFDEFDRTVPSARSPYGDLPYDAGSGPSEPSLSPARPVAVEARVPAARPDLEPTSVISDHGARLPASVDAPTELDAPTDFDDDPAPSGMTEPTAHAGTKPPARRRSESAAPPQARPTSADYEPDVTETTVGKKGKALGCLGGFGSMGCGGFVLAVVVGLAVLGGGYYYYSRDLPSVEDLQDYVPPTVTTVHSSDGRLLGEIYEERRYVRPLNEFPDYVKNAFLAAEDASFYSHGGVNYMGILRAIGRSAAQGEGPKGTSTITQQVAKNFLLTNERSIDRKIKEALLSWRIESTYDKDHILYLYLNSIYLGSQAYGVEAAARTYFGKSAEKLTHGEAAMLAGLPPRPSGYSPHKSWELARQRQEYVVGQMVEKGHLTAAEGKAALAEKLTIVPRGNTFLEQAPHFTEHARRFLVERYGKDRVVNEGLKITTTCDLDLQKVAQNAVTTQIFDVDQRIGFRREAIEETVPAAKIPAKRKQLEDAMREHDGAEIDPAGGRTPLPAKSKLVAGETYKAVITEVSKKWAKVGIGAHDGVIPIAWADWAYPPNPEKSWKYRDQNDLTTKYEYGEEVKTKAQILQPGDVILVKVEQPSVKLLDEKQQKLFKDTPGADSELVAARLWQKPEIEGAMLSMDVATGAIRAMVGGADFRNSQLNRALQSRRQVGSTFKPIVYAAAIQTKRVTSASMIADAPLAKETGAGFIWKPGNYGNDYLGHITLRQALAMSRNTCTVRVLDAADPGMGKDVIYDFARSLGVGGIPTYRLPADHVVKPSNDQLCPWLEELPEFKSCQDRWEDPSSPGKAWCRSCDQSMALGSASISMDEMVRAYSVFPSGGKLIEPYYVEEITDRTGKVLYKHEPVEAPEVIDPALATVATALMQGVVFGGTAGKATRLGLSAIAGKTGTTNDFKDAWFIGFSNDVITAAWVGYDEPRSMGVSSTGGDTALPIWMDYMAVAAPKAKDRPFPLRGGVVSALIDETTGMQVSSGGRSHLFLPGTVPESSGGAAGQISTSDVIDL